MVSPVDRDDDRSSMLITAADVVEDPDDHGRMLPTVEQSAVSTKFNTSYIDWCSFSEPVSLIRTELTGQDRS